MTAPSADREATRWTPDQPLRADADAVAFLARVSWRQQNGGCTFYEAARELAAACVAAAREARPDEGPTPAKLLDAVSEEELGGWIDKVRDVVFYVRVAARSKGYAIGVHGTLRRDIDLVAVPWTDEACSAEELAEAICDYLAELEPPVAFAWKDQGDDHRKAEDKPHGRKAWSLILRGGFIRPYIDLSVTARASWAVGEPTKENHNG